MRAAKFIAVFLGLFYGLNGRISVRKPTLNDVLKRSAGLPKVDKAVVLDSSGSGLSRVEQPRPLADLIGQLELLYSDSLDTIQFDNCCQPKFIGLGDVQPAFYPVKGGSYVLKHAYCDMRTDGGGWMGILRRDKNRELEFLRTFKSYRNGFGKLGREYWIGLENMHYFTSQPGGTELLVELVKDGVKYVAFYENFLVESRAANYTLRVSGFNSNKSNISDALSASNGFRFEHFDHMIPREEVGTQYGRFSLHCHYHFNPWWFGLSGNESCTRVALTKYYDTLFTDTALVPNGYLWTVNGQKVGFEYVEMKIRPKTWECGRDRYSNLFMLRVFYSHSNPSLNPFN